jgi:acetolactate synthase I/III small subunit
MSMQMPETMKYTILELTVENHPGVMSHVCGLFSRRAFNVEGILCMPIGDSSESRIWLKVNNDDRLNQLVKELEKLHDVHTVIQQKADHQIFVQLEEFFQT